jgi:serine/threonine protein kinase
MLKVLGVGAYGKVFLVNKVSNPTLYAMKVIKKDRIKTDKQRERTRTERWILEKLKHPFIMNLNYAFQTPTRLYMVIDYCPGGELFFHLQNFQKFNEKITKFYSACMLLGLEELHKFDIIYRE